MTRSMVIRPTEKLVPRIGMRIKVDQGYRSMLFGHSSNLHYSRILGIRE